MKDKKEIKKVKKPTKGDIKYAAFLAEKKELRKQWVRLRLRKVRILMGLNQEEFGDKLGMRRRTISDLEKGTVCLRRIHLLAFEYVYGIRLEWMMYGTGKIFIEKD